MGKTTKIGWTARQGPDGKLHPGGTYNPWIGCTKVGPECLHCYAERIDQNWNWTQEGWGPGKPRHFTGQGALNEIRALHRRSRKEGFRRAVFCASLCDVFDEEVSDDKRNELFTQIWNLDALEWLILTKRPEAAKRYLATVRGWPWPQVRLGVSAGTTKTFIKQWDGLLEVPALSRFVSMGPLLERIDLINILRRWNEEERPDWIIVEGESHDNRTAARPMAPGWVRDIRVACWFWGIPFFFKQWGEWAPVDQLTHNPQAQGIIAAGGEVPHHTFPDTGETVWCVGTKTAENRLDGKHYERYPAPIPIHPFFTQHLI